MFGVSTGKAIRAAAVAKMLSTSVDPIRPAQLGQT
jgi:hypothetical protein